MGVAPLDSQAMRIWGFCIYHLTIPSPVYIRSSLPKNANEILKRLDLTQSRWRELSPWRNSMTAGGCRPRAAVHSLAPQVGGTWKSPKKHGDLASDFRATMVEMWFTEITIG